MIRQRKGSTKLFSGEFSILLRHLLPFRLRMKVIELVWGEVQSSPSGNHYAQINPGKMRNSSVYLANLIQGRGEGGWCGILARSLKLLG